MVNKGVYQIKNLVDGNVYIGSSSVNIDSRWQCHKRELLKGSHCNFKLQQAWDFYGESAFDFSILSKCPSEYCVRLEQYFLDFNKPYYNICKIAGSNLGTKRSLETRLKMSIAQKGLKRTLE